MLRCSLEPFHPALRRSAAPADAERCWQDIVLDLHPALSTAELLRNACVNLGVFPLVYHKGRVVNVAAFLSVESEGDNNSGGVWLTIDVDPGRSVASVLRGIPRDCEDMGLRLVVVHADTVTSSVALARTFSESVDAEFIEAGFAEHGL